MTEHETPEDGAEQGPTGETDVKRINCTQCGAGLNVLGGGRVRAHVCGYCGAEMDTQDNYKVLQQFKHMQRPSSPFEIGMEGEIDGVKMIIIGTIGKRESHFGRSWTWVDHQVFSPTHGYGWLTWENGRAIFTRKMRKVPSPAKISDSTIENSENRPTTRLDDKSFTYYSSGKPKISFVEGEFNFVPKMGDTNSVVSLLSSDEMLAMIDNGKEVEYEVSTMPDQDAVFESFGIDKNDLPAPLTRHPLEPFKRTEQGLLARNVAFACAAACLVMALFFGSFGTHIATGQAGATQPLKISFDVTKPSQLVQVRLSADVDNSWAYIEGEITDSKNEAVKEFGQGIEYYHGYDDGSWSEGSRDQSLYLRLDEGTYTVNLVMAEGGVQYGSRPAARAIFVDVWEGVVSTYWLWMGFVVFLLIGAYFLIQRFFHHKSRWAGSDWDDE